MTAPRADAPAAEGRDKARRAFDALYRESRDDIYAYLAGLLRDRSAAEEVTSQAFERAWRRREQINPDRGTPRAWLFGIARNAALDELKRRRRSAVLPEDDVLDTATGVTDSGAEAAIDRALLQTALRSLSGRERELVALKFFSGLTNAEIAKVLGVSESNAGTKLHRTIQKLRRACDETA